MKQSLRFVMLLSTLIVCSPKVWSQFCSPLDSTTNHHDGIFVGSSLPDCVDGISGTALNFNGQNYIEVPNSPDFNLAELTVEAWIKSTTTQFGTVVSTVDDNSPCGTTAFDITGNEFDQRVVACVSTRCVSAPNVFSLNALNNNQWHHLAMTLGGGFLKYYVDGVFQGSTATSMQLTNSLARLTIGFQNTHGGRYWHGVIDEVRLSKIVRYAGNFTPQQSYVIDANTVGYWKFDSQSNIPTCSAADVSPHHHDGTFVGAIPPACVEGIHGTALSFSGQNYIRVPNSSDFNLSTMTVEAWIKSTTTQFGTVVSTVDDNSPCGTTAFDITGNEFDQRVVACVSTRCVSAPNVFSLNALNNNQWHHLAMTLGGGFLKYYVDGLFQGSTATSMQLTNSLADLTIGFQNTHGGRYWHGVIDEVRLSKIVRYTGSFTPQQSYVIDADTVGYWPFGSCDTDVTAPEITCPTDVLKTNDAGQCSAIVEYALSATDDCSGVTSLTGKPSSGSAFPIGTTVVTVTAIDGSGNTNSCNFNVTVVDGEAPRVVCRPAPNPSGKISPKATEANPSGYYQLLARDDCDTDPDIYVKDTGSSFVAGPFHNGDIIRLKHTGATPSTTPGTAPIVSILNFNGNGLEIAVDAGGNTTADADGCLMQ